MHKNLPYHGFSAQERAQTSPQGVRNDARLFQEDLFLQRRICPWEYGLGDKAYVGEPQILTEWKGSNLSVEQMRFNVTVQHSLPRPR